MLTTAVFLLANIFYLLLVFHQKELQIRYIDYLIKKHEEDTDKLLKLNAIKSRIDGVSSFTSIEKALKEKNKL